MIVPFPLQVGQVVATEKNPCVLLIWPEPPQSGQVAGELPLLAPEPLQSTQDSKRGISILYSLPRAASSRETSKL